MKKNNTFSYLIWLIPLAALGYFVVFSRKLMTIPTADGKIYMEVAENLINGSGFYFLSDGQMQPYIFWPPLYPVLLAVFKIIIKTDIVEASFWLRFVFLAYSFLILYKIFRLYRLSNFLMGLGFLIFWFSWTFYLYFFSLSETIFIPLFLTSFYFFYKWFTEYRSAYLIWAGIFLGFALLTRYGAFGFWLAYLLLITARSKSGRQVFENGLRLSLPVLILFVPWYVYTTQASYFFNREVGFHLLGYHHLEQLEITLANWMMPGMTVYLIFPFTILFFIGLLFIWKRFFTVLQDYRFLLPAFTGIVYLLFLLFSIITIDYDTPLDFRILSPIFLLLLPVGLYLLNEIGKDKKWIFIILTGLLFVSHVANAFEKTRELNQQIEKIKNLNDSTFIKTIRKFQNRKQWSNVTDLLKDYVRNDTFVYEFPVKYDRKSLKQNLHFRRDMQELKEQLNKNHGMVIYFFGYEDRAFLPDLTDLDTLFEGYPVLRFDEGLIIFHSRFRDSLKLAQK